MKESFILFMYGIVLVMLYIVKTKWKLFFFRVCVCVVFQKCMIRGVQPQFLAHLSLSLCVLLGHRSYFFLLVVVLRLGPIEPQILEKKSWTLFSLWWNLKSWLRSLVTSFFFAFFFSLVLRFFFRSLFFFIFYYCPFQNN